MWPAVRVMRAALISALILFATIWVLRDFITQKALEQNDAAWGWGLGFKQPLNSMNAQLLFDKGKLEAAKAAARKALDAKPGDVAAIRALALVADKEGKPEYARALMTLGGRWGWRDTTTQRWLYQDALYVGELENAVIHGEALVARRQLRDEVFPVFAAIAADPKTRPLIVNALERGNEWRGAFYAYLRNAPPVMQADLVSLFQDMSSSAAKPTPDDIAPLIEALAAAGKGNDARSLWVKYYKIPPSIVQTVVDGGFDNLPTEQALSGADNIFSWQFDRTAEIYILSDRSSPTNKVVHIAAAGQNRTSVISQRLVLAQGGWTLSYRVKSGMRDLASRLRVTLRCDGGNSQILGSAPMIPSLVNQWHRIQMPIVVKRGCNSQWLRVSTLGTVSGDATDIWLDDFSLLQE